MILVSRPMRPGAPPHGLSDVVRLYYRFFESGRAFFVGYRGVDRKTHFSCTSLKAVEHFLSAIAVLTGKHISPAPL